MKQMYGQLSAALKDPAVRDKLSMQGMDIVGGDSAETERFLRAEMTRWAQVVRDHKISAGD